MIKTKFVFAVSFLAMMAVNVANAKIAATSYVDKGVETATNAANAAQTSANAANAAAGKAQTSADNAQDAAEAAQASADAAAASAKTANDAVATKQTKMLATEVNDTVEAAKDEYYPSVGLMETSIADANNDVMDSVNAKLASVSTTGTGSVVKSITKNGTAVQGTLGYIASSDITDGTIKNADIASDAAIAVSKINGLGSLATKSAVATGDITDGTITNADISSSAAIAISKISGLQAALDGKQATMTVDSALSSTSTNPVQNKVVNTALAGKQATLGTSNVVTSGNGNVVTAVSASNGTVTVTKGTSLGSLATKSAVATGDITDGTITNADISGSAAIAISKISGLQSALDGKQDYMLATEVDDTVEAAKDEYYPSVGLMETSIAYANNDVMDSVNAKLASVSTTGTGSVVKSITKNGTAVQGTLGYIASSDITDGTIKNADIASDAAIAISKISGLQAALDGKQATMTVDSALSSTSTNPVQNKVVNTALAGKQATISDLASIRSGATAGSTALQKADITTGSANGTISVEGTNVAVKGLGTAAYTASTAYATAAQGTKADNAEASANKIDTLDGFDGDKAVAFPTVNLTETLISDANNDVMDSVNAKVAKAQGSSAANKAVITNSSGTITTGTIATGMITDSAVTSAKLAANAVTSAKINDGAVALADLASNSVNSSKIVDSSVATADLANGSVTPAKTSGVIGAIPSGSATSTTYATIWVE